MYNPSRRPRCPCPSTKPRFPPSAEVRRLTISCRCRRRSTIPTTRSRDTIVSIPIGCTARSGSTSLPRPKLYTRCAYPPSEEAKKVRDSEPRQDFYHHGDPLYPVIPGASLRGMVRALVRILSYSRISRRGGLLGVHDQTLVYRAVADQDTGVGKAYNQKFLHRRRAKDFDYPSERLRGGYLEPDPRTGGWRVRPARRIQGADFVRINLRDLERNGFPTHDADGAIIANRTERVWVWTRTGAAPCTPQRADAALRAHRSAAAGAPLRAWCSVPWSTPARCAAATCIR